MERIRFNVVFIDEDTEKEVRELPKDVQLMIANATKDRLAIAPVSYGKPLRFSWRGHRRIRIGKYRIIYRVDEKKMIVTIVKADIRRDVYD